VTFSLRLQKTKTTMQKDQRQSPLLTTIPVSVLQPSYKQSK